MHKEVECSLTFMLCILHGRVVNFCLAVFTLELKTKAQHSLVYVQYKFDGDEHEVQVDPHGNSKKNSTPYYRTMETTKKRLKSITENTKPSASILIDLEEAGGISNVKSSGEIVRNIRQAKHYRTTGNSSNTASGVTNDLQIRGQGWQYVCPRGCRRARVLYFVSI